MRLHVIFLVCFLLSFSMYAQLSAFEFNDVIAQARSISRTDYTGEKESDKGFPSSMTYDQYRAIAFKPEYDIPISANAPFRLEFLPAGFRFTQPVTIYCIKNGVPVVLKGKPEMFANNSGIPFPSESTVPLSGFRVKSTINNETSWNEFLVFQGASYFRAVPRNGIYGLSARGLIVHPSGKTAEEFPLFKTFWIQESGMEEKSLSIFALLDSPSITGAYQFVIRPGSDTVLNVKAVLFPRISLGSLGIAPLTSMFFFDESDKFGIDDFRSGVHDSDGFWLQNARGEFIWRQLINPSSILYSSFTDRKPKGFGLIQRARALSCYQDFEAGYERRPDAWIEPGEDWPDGTADLIEIPSESETNDNIVTFWNIRTKLKCGNEVHISYTIHWTMQLPVYANYPAKVIATRSGPPFPHKKNSRLFAVDFSDPGISISALTPVVTTSEGSVIGIRLERNTDTGGIRMSFELNQNSGSTSELRGLLLNKGKPVTETWLYRWSSHE